MSTKAAWIVSNVVFYPDALYTHLQNQDLRQILNENDACKHQGILVYSQLFLLLQLLYYFVYTVISI